MSLIPESQSRSVRGISPQDYQRIYDFLQGAVYCWCKNQSGLFGLRDLMGGTNFFWARTPLIALWNKHRARGLPDDAAITAAAIDGGWILKRVINDDRRTFSHTKEGLVRKYHWTGDDGNVAA
jgi:hypothetical protein